MRGGPGLRLAALTLACALVPATAWAAPPPNDNRQNAQNVPALPATIDGTTVESTLETNEPSSCSSPGGSVWYRVTPGREGRVIVGLAANGDLDAVVDVFRVRRSQLSSINCDVTDERGRASLAFPVGPNETYLIRVSRLSNSVDDTFRLTLQLGQPIEQPPGGRLPANGASGSLDRVLNPSDAYSVELRAGVTYRFNLASRACTPLYLYRPGIRSFNARPVERASCGGYIAFTPDAGESGVYSLLAQASSSRRPTPYRLMAARAGADDTAPGRFIRNYARVGGRLDATAIDVVDLYRFDVERRSDLDLAIETNSNFRVTLITAGGKRVATTSDELSMAVKKGRYFAVVRASRGASGAYKLRRVSRTITRTRALIDGRGGATVTPGERVALGARITPGVAGPVSLRVQRFDPVEGWQFARAFRVRTSGAGTGEVGWRPPSVGRWRVRALFRGTRGASPSQSGWTNFRVQGPLEE